MKTGITEAKQALQAKHVKQVKPCCPAACMNCPYYDMPMNTNEAAFYTGYSVKSMGELARQRKVPSYKTTNGHLTFKRSELDVFSFRKKRHAVYELQDEADRLLEGRK